MKESKDLSPQEIEKILVNDRNVLKTLQARGIRVGILGGEYPAPFERAEQRQRDERDYRKRGLKIRDRSL